MLHFLQFFFAPKGQPWYMGAVWGNVVAVLPLFLVGAAGFTYHHVVLKRLHRAHSARLREILDVLDPSTDGGIALLHSELAGYMDPMTHSGIGLVLERLDNPTRRKP
jgi:hypothetical protein